jgi:hypothetical protein
VGRSFADTANAVAGGGHGTLDALFTFTHTINMAPTQQKRLHVVFVDFQKALDTVGLRRDVMIARCKQLGVRGQYLDTLLLLYIRKAQQQVCIGGEMGRLYEAYVGTKQGSELSLLLVADGMLHDMLHELERMQVPGAGPLLALQQLRAPDISYTMMSYSLRMMILPNISACWITWAYIFCDIFKMEVNQHESKTCARSCFLLP